MRKYLDLAEEAEERGYRATIVPVQVGSRGMVEVESFERLQPSVYEPQQRFSSQTSQGKYLKSPKIYGQNETGQTLIILCICLRCMYIFYIGGLLQ